MTMIRKGTFTSAWDGGDQEITTNAELNTITGEITAESIDTDDLDIEILDKEYFTDIELAEDFEVCATCHSYILKETFVDVDGSAISIMVCSDPNCESHQS